MSSTTTSRFTILTCDHGFQPVDAVDRSAPFEHVDTIRPMHDPTHPQYEAFGLLFDVIYDYKQVHCPF
jgi:hypothetical protein